MATSERGPFARAVIKLMVTLIVLGLATLVVYLVSDLNRRHYRLAAHAGNLVVERGRFFPVGFELYLPDTPLLREAYAPIPVPPDEVLAPTGTFEDRGDVDRALFGLISGWARGRLEADDSVTSDLAATYVKRLEVLPGLSEDQRAELRGMRAELAYRRGSQLAISVAATLRRAQEAFRQAMTLGSRHSTEAAAWAADIDRRIATCVFTPPTLPGTVAPSPEPSKKPPTSTGAP